MKHFKHTTNDHFVVCFLFLFVSLQTYYEDDITNNLNNKTVFLPNTMPITKSFTYLLTLVLTFVFLSTSARTTLDFRCLDIQDGLADCHISSICKDKQGYIWVGTATGLSRYDGFRFKNFYNVPADTTTIKSNCIGEIQCAPNGDMWIRTDLGYSIYSANTEKFTNNLIPWMRKYGIQGYKLERVFFDKQGNTWVAVNGIGVYYLAKNSTSAYLFEASKYSLADKFSKNVSNFIPCNTKAGHAGNKSKYTLPYNLVNCITQNGNTVVVTYTTGIMICLDGDNQRIVWINKRLANLTGYASNDYNLYIDNKQNYWLNDHSQSRSWVYSSAQKKWYDNVSSFLAANGIEGVTVNHYIKYIAQDSKQNLWLASEHDGLFCVNLNKKTWGNYVYNRSQPNPLPNNTLQCIYIDKNDEVWIGTYKNGIAYYSPSLAYFPTYLIGDINTIAQDRAGNYWCGSNDNGLVCYNLVTGATIRYNKQQTQLGSDIYVCSYRANDGSLWFGTFNGGMLHYDKGQFTAYRKQKNGLASDNVWSICEDHNGDIVIGTLGSGVQVYNRHTGKFITYNAQNSSLRSDYIASIRINRLGYYIIGTSLGIDIFNPRTKEFYPLPATKDGSTFSSHISNDIYIDSRGLIWNANMSGLDVYDPESERIYRINETPRMSYGVSEDSHGAIWVSSSTGVSRIKVGRNGDNLTFFTNRFTHADGLQQRRFNYRAIYCDNNDRIIIGGQDGINVIPASAQNVKAENANVIFADIMMYDHVLKVGESYNGRVILTEALAHSTDLRLSYNENVFTILLASDNISLPQKNHFQYRLIGFDKDEDKWITTMEGQPSISYMNLSPGTYTLQVRVIDRNGIASRSISELRIVIEPPVWLSWYACVFYVIMVCCIAWFAWYFTWHRRMTEMKMKHLQNEAERKHKANEMKLSFLTNISHELRTPLSLVIAPVQSLIEEEEDDKKRSRLEMILRNARRLLNLVNQTLDLRKIDVGRMNLKLERQDIVKFVNEIVDNFATLSQKRIQMSFIANPKYLYATFDKDKMSKVINNLLSNAYKFTPAEGGEISVTISIHNGYNNLPSSSPEEMVSISVADNGCGISDDNKQHIFERFYQISSDKEPVFGGSGLGLHIAKEYTEMHGGQLCVADNKTNGVKCGTVFTIILPTNLKIEEDKPKESTDCHDINKPQTTESTTDTQQDEGQSEKNNSTAIGHAGKPRLLLVDDSEDFLLFMTEILSTRYEVTTATNGILALKAMEQQRPDIILSDVMMPEMDGNAFCRKVKSDERWKTIPFVMLTARLSTEHEIEGLSNGADEYFTKPFNIDILNLRITRLLHQQNTVHTNTEQDTTIITEESENTITPLDQKFLDKVTKYVEDNLSNADLTVEKLSEDMGMSRVNLYKRILSLTGNTPSEFIRNIRMQHAKHLLMNEGYNVSEVAYRVGFNQPRLFSKYFKEQFGILPSQITKHQ